MEFLQSIQDYFNQVGDSINTLLSDVQTLIDNLNNYITFSTYYIYASGIAIAILLIMGIAALSNQGRIMRQNQSIMEKLESLNFEEGEKENG